MIRWFTVLVLVIAAVAPGRAAAQIARTRSADGPPPDAPKVTPRNPRRPLAGVWEGAFTLRGGPGAGHPIPMILIVTADDTAKGGYIAERVLPNGRRVPPESLVVANREMQWKQQNNGGGFWVYAGKIVGQDTLAGTVALKDWPQLPAGEKPPTGTFSLVRRRPGA